MTAGQLIDALSASFFCLIGLWAGAARGHWFLRVAVAGGCLLTPLLGAMHLVTIEFGLQIAVIMLGLAVVRRPDDWQPRFSVETALLAMVVVAVTAAVLREGLDLPLTHWVWAVGAGVGTGLLGLACLWLVCGRARWYWRGLGFAAYVIVFFVGGLAVDALRTYLWGYPPGQTLGDALATQFAAEAVGRWLQHNGPSVALGIAILLGVIWLAVHSGWFSRRADDAPPPRRTRQTLARAGIVAIVALMMAPLLAIFYRLLTPEPMWAYDPPTPNGYDELVAVGRRIPEVIGRSLENYRYWNADPAEVCHYINELSDVYEAIDVALEMPCLPPPLLDLSDQQSSEYLAAYQCVAATSMRWQSFRCLSDNDAFFAAAFADAQIENTLAANEGLYSVSIGADTLAVSFGQRLWRLSADDCRRYLPQVVDFDRSLDPYDELVLRQRIIDQNSGWESHLQMILNDWNVALGHGDENWWEWYRWHEAVANLRMVTAQMALRCYRLERNALPASLEELVPEYLPAVPVDPFDGQPLRYRRDGSRYTLYSVGANLVDDGGSVDQDPALGRSRDLAANGPFMPPNWKLVADVLQPVIVQQLRRAPGWLRQWAEALRERN